MVRSVERIYVSSRLERVNVNAEVVYVIVYVA